MSNNIYSLPVIETISPYISQRQIGQLPVIVVDHPQVRAAVTLQGAHLLSWHPQGEQPVLWLSDNTEFSDGVAIRGGVPICFPWFGPAAQPSHGFARLLPWEFTAHREDEQGVALTFTLRDDAQTRAQWPHAFTLIARFHLTQAECHIELEAHGDYDFTSALHTYFEIGDIRRVSISGLGESYLDNANNRQPGSQHGSLTFTGRSDRINTQAQPVSLIDDPVLQRTIEVQHVNYSDVVSWNPGAELSHSMSDLTDEGYQTFVCVETARVNQPLVATPQAPARLSTRLRLRK